MMGSSVRGHFVCRYQLSGQYLWLLVCFSILELTYINYTYPEPWRRLDDLGI